jgi:DNA polymerase III subunit delta'
MLFSEIPGQEEIKQRLVRSVLHDRVSHAQLFAGSPGTMKLPMAVAYARFLCCTQRVIPDSDPVRADACGKCPSCLKFNSLAHPDLHFVFPVSTSDTVEKKPTSDQYLKQWRELWKKRKGIFSLNDWYSAIGIGNKQPYIYTEDCNQIIKKLSYKSYESEYKVMIVWMAEKLYRDAAPRLLKILEEPSDKTLFILIAEDTKKILPTILSRTQQLLFPGLKRSEMAGWLEQQGYPRDRADRVASLAEGNLHKALEMAGSDGSTEEFFLNLRNWLRYCFKPQASMAELIAHSEKMAGMGREMQKRFFAYALGIIHLCFKGGITASLPNDNSEEATLIRNLSPFIHKSNITGYETLFNEAFHHIEHNANPKILFLDMSLQLVKLIKQPV